MEFRNETSLTFNDISAEKWRKYRFPDDTVIKIKEPIKLNVSQNGHRIFDASGHSHYIPMGWIHLEWKVKEGKPHFQL